jgi:hypothetical protein
MGLQFGLQSNIVMVRNECSCQIFILKARLLASNENGVAIRFVRWKVRESIPSCCRFPCRLSVGTDGHHAYPDVGRTVLTGVLEGYLRGIFEFGIECYVSALNYDVRASVTYSHLHSFDPKVTYSNSGMWL